MPEIKGEHEDQGIQGLQDFNGTQGEKGENGAARIDESLKLSESAALDLEL